MNEAMSLLNASFPQTNTFSNAEPEVRAPIAPTQKQVLVTDMPRRQRPVIPSNNPFSLGMGRAMFHNNTGKESKDERLARLFRPPIDIMFLGDFNSAIAMAERERKWLLVNVLDETEFACQVNKREKGRGEKVISF